MIYSFMVDDLPTLPLACSGQIVRIDDEIAFGTEFAHPTLRNAIALPLTLSGGQIAVGWANGLDL
ncbi:MAG: hypothetical protein F6K50_25765 [Moorea sp. SIO3I7]|uniref:hypothetical protein n=1 Tax=unclassified Moorena TaxID=2683338 RepID=UPI0013C1674E|nr:MULTISPECIES: hypothetical protein [unclassified Moorena]NEN98788.1 hypothetical protein [Moorena sp. SIO3I7]NEO09006.1 hypothetical protein [Moorena sp. SIO3I8]NEO22460.1 hypothetical protein [Moorena sp. SIO4A5]NEP23904.1 hypothetical protein [Moorena sp. SIO3I6]NEQ56554.1 hypothetical protein [Moorena sp. SIO4A1]